MVIGDEANNTRLSCCSAVSLNEVRGYGGGMWIGSEIEDISLNFISPAFTKNTALMGRDLFASFKDLRTKVNSTSFSWALNMNSNQKLNSLCRIDNGFFTSLTDLLIFITGQKLPLVIENDRIGDNAIYCGREVPCKTLDYSVLQAEGEGMLTLSVDGFASLASEITLNSHTIKSSNETYSKLYVDNTLCRLSGSVITVLGSLKLLRIELSIPSEFSELHEVLIFSSASEGKIEVEKYRFEKQTSEQISYLLFRISGGGFEMDDVVMSEMTFSNFVFVLSNNVEASVRQLNFAQIELSESLFTFYEDPILQRSLYSAENNISSSYVFQSCLFYDLIVSNNDCAAIVSERISTSVSFDGCSFEKISSVNSAEGGAIRVSIEESGEFSLNETTVGRECNCEYSTHGKGGFICINCLNRRSDFSLDKLIFQENMAFTGHNVYISCDS
ncbi:uncharacterized protein MONOS_1352 [Monocercomonoides exilis]|uniref:uncharacterized protein n=1 Tax=Monocercomonoides exilis TaxID=2049356 RepID=UPI00355A8359|nr:hypothetical protein MONOS_1352 [Monocercomonoides exilis]|eukprot:MONOS_1352.1-p1 / transcript=MONOS_1352.1 / gene=MONOS_1352 / organism=Monocercomonoides_exilis_PA203 / gene_product=unspecified product / transcript_product=unspecified product / location=Mono_scaffold00023:126673-128004(-) / protein_length=444 / sequence_SO=supercontig / SO=protein_coding / is_pseudo=false